MAVPAMAWRICSVAFEGVLLLLLTSAVRLPTNAVCAK
jgi:hypothetical protein